MTKCPWPLGVCLEQAKALNLNQALASFDEGLVKNQCDNKFKKRKT